MDTSLMTEFLRKSGGAAVIDGGLATELERHGADLNDPLWSAKCLLTSPHLIRGVHIDYLEAGADIIITASYQATIQGFVARGYTKEEGETLLKRSVEIALEARDIYKSRCESTPSDIVDRIVLKHRPILVAASVGSYGAYLADGSEYSGNYGDAITLKFLKDFHRRRVQVLAVACPDLIAFETIPNKLEAQAFAELMEEESINIPAWFSFNSKDGVNVVSGDSFVECATIAESCRKVVAIGINCTPPRFIHGLISSISKVTTKPILVYPNSGESYDPVIKQWVVSSFPLVARSLHRTLYIVSLKIFSHKVGHQQSQGLSISFAKPISKNSLIVLLQQNTGVSNDDFVSYVNKWIDVGASLVGGCCRTTPETIRGIYRSFSNKRGLSLSDTILTLNK
ncbi:homocysteine S-methyltransferase 2 isoform X1 [Cannabis sativa]|uniref:homocysteine S-methyltransferase 2 isoform X1 n=1 Tax=Cannabis sativa TaxID=3483 RepID=UPI0029C9F4F9|nr:homocysteine S-methyltransferase 2 isoform X1 [Cannabis sativa]